MKKYVFSLSAIALIVGCASTAVTPISRNQFLISTSAAPACGQTGAQRVVLKMAAVETIRQGFDGFIVGGASSDSTVQAVSTGPTGAFTTGTIGPGNTFNANTTYTGSSVIFTGKNNAQLAITAFKRGQPGYNQSVDARTVLGEDWQELVQSGVVTC